MNIVEAFKIIKADETKCARRAEPESDFYFLFAGGFGEMYNSEGLCYTTILGISDTLSEWEVLPIASLNNQEESK